ncbi:MAG: UDP-2,3-diacylglucosamine diphosphatase [Pseudomonadales bacterium]
MDEAFRNEPEKSHFRAIFLSDIHLGTRGCQAERLLNFLKRHSCDELYLVGDIIDGWRLRSQLYWPQSHSNVVRRFLTLAKRGTRVVFVTGNHDEFLRKYADLTLGNLELVDRAVHRTADGQQLLVVHGDEFDVVTRYHRWIAFLGDVGYNLLLELNRCFNRLRVRFGYGYWSLSAWVKQRVKRAVSYIGEYEDALVHQCRREGFDGVVCGHIHHAEIRDLDGVRYMNCGDWVESCTALVEDKNGRFCILDWSAEHDLGSNVIEFEPERLRA